MKVVVEGPTEFQGNIMGGLNQRRGIIVGTFERATSTVVEAEVPLAEMFGYSNRAALGHPGQGRVHDGVRQLPPAAQGLTDEVIKEANERRKSSVA